MNDLEARVSALLRERLPNTPNDLKTAVTACEALRLDVLVARVEAQKQLAEKREQFRHPKDKDLTDFDRKTMLEAAVADHVSRYELLSGLESLLAERLTLAKLLLT